MRTKITDNVPMNRSYGYIYVYVIYVNIYAYTYIIRVRTRYKLIKVGESVSKTKGGEEKLIKEEERRGFISMRLVYLFFISNKSPCARFSFLFLPSFLRFLFSSHSQRFSLDALPYTFFLRV